MVRDCCLMEEAEEAEEEIASLVRETGLSGGLESVVDGLGMLRKRLGMGLAIQFLGSRP